MAKKLFDGIEKFRQILVGSYGDFERQDYLKSISRDSTKVEEYYDNYTKCKSKSLLRRSASVVGKAAPYAGAGILTTAYVVDGPLWNYSAPIALAASIFQPWTWIPLGIGYYAAHWYGRRKYSEYKEKCHDKVQEVRKRLPQRLKR